jgi:hypothetical protein
METVNETLETGYFGPPRYYQPLGFWKDRSQTGDEDGPGDEDDHKDGERQDDETGERQNDEEVVFQEDDEAGTFHQNDRQNDREKGNQKNVPQNGN